MYARFLYTCIILSLHEWINEIWRGDMLNSLHNLACGSPQVPICLLPSVHCGLPVVPTLIFLFPWSHIFIHCMHFLTNPASCFYKYLLLSFTCLMASFLPKSNFSIVFLGRPLKSISKTVRAAFLYASVTPDTVCLWKAARTLLKRGPTDLLVHGTWLCGKLCKLLWISWYMLDSGFTQHQMREFKINNLILNWYHQICWIKLACLHQVIQDTKCNGCLFPQSEALKTAVFPMLLFGSNSYQYW